MRDIDLIRGFREDVGEDDLARARARARLEHHITARRVDRRSPGRRFRLLRHRIAIAIAALLLVSGTAAASGLLTGSDDLDLGTVACLDTARTIEKTAGRGVFMEPTGDPVARCASLWRAGELDGKARSEAPALVACAASGSPVVVIPGTPATCRSLKLQPLPHDYATAAATLGKAKAILQREDDLHRPRSRCESPAHVLVRARRLLSNAGLGAVAVESAGDRRCAGFFMFTDGRVVRLGTLSPAAAEAAYLRRRISSLVDPVFAAARGCIDPLSVASDTRRVLREAGLPDVRVSVDEAGGPCLERGGFIVEADSVVFSRAPR